jgi:hypothetical protein
VVRRTDKPLSPPLEVFLAALREFRKDLQA